MVLRLFGVFQYCFWISQFERYLDHFARFYVRLFPPKCDFARVVLRPTMASWEHPESALARSGRTHSSGEAPSHRRSPTSPNCHLNLVCQQELVCRHPTYDLFFHFWPSQFSRAFLVNLGILVQPMGWQDCWRC